uniref:Uncharacterized protein n=1 Tax=Cannabis sativa TaxID=3483 RepID=A0A803PLN9_CANSA
MEKIDNSIEPGLLYGPELKGAALPNNGYDRYRTDFSKGNAWPLLMHLAHNSLTGVIPGFSNRQTSHPWPLLPGESSKQQHNINIEAIIPKSVPSTNDSSSSVITVANITQLSMTNAHKNVTPNSLTTTKVLFAPATLTNIVDNTSSMKTKNTISSPSVTDPPTPAVAILNVDDLTYLYIPDICINHNTNVTYPPMSTTVHAPLNGTDFHHAKMNPFTTTDAVINTTLRQNVDKENNSPNRLSKRLPENISTRKILKRCRGP